MSDSTASLPAQTPIAFFLQGFKLRKSAGTPFLCLTPHLGFCVAGKIQQGTTAWRIVWKSRLPWHLSQGPGNEGAESRCRQHCRPSPLLMLWAWLPWAVNLQGTSSVTCFVLKLSLSHYVICPKWLITVRSWLALEFLGSLCFPGIRSAQNTILFCFTMNSFEMPTQQAFCRKC